MRSIAKRRNVDQPQLIYCRFIMSHLEEINNSLNGNTPKRSLITNFFKPPSSVDYEEISQRSNGSTPSMLIQQQKSVNKVMLEHKKLLYINKHKIQHHNWASKMNKANLGLVLSPENKKRRITWSEARKKEIVNNIYHIKMTIRNDYDKDIGVAKILHYFKTTDSGLETLKQSMVSRWIRAFKSKKQDKKRGRKINETFEAAVIGKLMVTQLTKDGSIEVLANAAFTYACFTYAAMQVKKEAIFNKCSIVNKLSFTTGWVQGVKKRFNLRKRRCTSVLKKKPPISVIRNFYTELHETVTEKSVKAEYIFNEDETAIVCCPELLHQYINQDAQRAVTPYGGEEGRFTALLGSSSNGNMLPLMMILKVGTQNTFDLTAEKTLKRVKDQLKLDTWEYKVFKTTITDGKGVVREYCRPLLQNPANLDLITVQHKAWNDAVGMLMYLKYQLQPWKEQNAPNDQCMMVVDNVSFHHVQEVTAAFATAQWILKFFPPNMTDELQPMDLVVNAVLKAEMRKLRAKMVYDALDQFRQELSTWSICVRDDNTLTKPTFNPPKPTYKDGVQTMLNIHHGKLKSVQFQDSLKKCFEKVGLIPFNEHGAYKEYTPKKLGSLDSIKFETLNAEDSLAGWCVDVSTLRDCNYVDEEFAIPAPVPAPVPTVVDLTAAAVDVDDVVHDDVDVDAVVDDIISTDEVCGAASDDDSIDDDSDSSDEDDGKVAPLNVPRETLAMLAAQGEKMRPKRLRTSDYNPHEPRSLQDRWRKK